MVEEKELDHWTTEEKLLVPFQREADKEGRSTFWFIFSVVMLSAALISLAEEVQHIETGFSGRKHDELCVVEVKPASAIVRAFSMEI